VLRRLLFKATGGHLNPGPSHAEAGRQRLIGRVRTPISKGRRCIASVSLKGGVGKTTTTVMLGHTLAAYRGDNVIAIDANPDAGNLAGRIHRQTALTARDLLRAEAPLERYADLRPFTSQSDSRLQVLAGDSDAMLNEPFSAYDYHCVLTALERFYSLILTDCGTGILHDAMRAVLWYADQLVVVTTPSVDSAKALNQLLGWLDEHDQHALTTGAVLVVNGLRRDSRMSVQEFESYFGPRCRGVTAIPYDPVLATGAECQLADLDPKTQRAYLDLAALVADGFVNETANGR
jgi:MinD-like ATPase involved in chromosome partitioning or flagellar assembly